ncbi:hypothetical protein BFP72_07415 [Reichenbachiella sp. 5M10]|uniref:hypothetical protein n=1 Tax=Reichenbachiella sp. 5M10 TaxID=1889772 RepID=UPI000C14F0DC|nr:hypothetical protein [Reichenbachiella sp. 5M10]PIB35235.1 hypothetical protein BFP72_07415 [Reichenbachiella sp. 5M10]
MTIATNIRKALFILGVVFHTTCFSQCSQQTSGESVGIKNFKLGCNVSDFEIFDVFDSLKYNYTVNQTSTKIFESACYFKRNEDTDVYDYCFKKAVDGDEGSISLEIQNKCCPLNNVDKTTQIIKKSDLDQIGGHDWLFIDFRVFNGKIYGISVFLFSDQVTDQLFERYGEVNVSKPNSASTIWNVGLYQVKSTEYDNYNGGHKGTLVIYNDLSIEKEIMLIRKEQRKSKSDF